MPAARRRQLDNGLIAADLDPDGRRRWAVDEVLGWRGGHRNREQGLSPSPEKYQGTVLSWFSVRQLISLSKRDFCSNTFIFRLFASAPVTVAPARPEIFSGFEGHFGRFHLFCGAVAESETERWRRCRCTKPHQGM